MATKNPYDVLNSEFGKFASSYAGVLIIYYSVSKFIAWLWCLPIPHNQITDFKTPPPLKIAEPNCDLEINYDIMKNEEFQGFIESLKETNRRILLNGTDYNLSTNHSSPIMSPDEIGMDEEKVESTKFVENGDQSQLSEMLRHFDYSTLKDGLLDRTGTENLSEALEAYLPCNLEDAKEVGNVGIGDPAIKIYIPIYISIRKCVLDDTHVLITIGNYGNFDSEQLRARMVSPGTEPLELTKGKSKSSLCEPFYLGGFLLSRQTMSFEGDTNYNPNSLWVNLYFADNLISRKKVTPVMTRLVTATVPLCSFSDLHGPRKTGVILFIRYLIAALIGVVGWFMMIFVVFLTYFIITALIISKVSVAVISPELAAITTVLLLYVNFRTSIDTRHQQSKERVRIILNKLDKCRKAFMEFEKNLKTEFFLSKDKVKNDLVNIKEWNSTILSKEFASMYYRLRGFLLVRRMKNYSKSVENSILQYTYSKNETSILSEDILNQLNSCEDITKIFKFHDQYQLLYKEINGLQDLIKYLEKIERWLKLKYSL